MNRRDFLKKLFGTAAVTGLVAGLPFKMREASPKPKTTFTQKQRQLRLVAGLGDPRKVKVYYKLGDGRTYEGTGVKQVASEYDESLLILFEDFVLQEPMTVMDSFLVDDEGHLLKDKLFSAPLHMIPEDILKMCYRLKA